MALIVDRQQLCQTLGIAESTVTLWQRHQCPVVHAGRGRGNKSLYDLDQVRRWMETHGRGFAASIYLRRERQAQAEAKRAEAARRRGERLSRSVPDAGRAIAQVLEGALIPWAAALVRARDANPRHLVAEFALLLTAIGGAGETLFGEGFELDFTDRLRATDGGAGGVADLELEIRRAALTSDPTVAYLAAVTASLEGFASEHDGPAGA